MVKDISIDQMKLFLVDEAEIATSDTTSTFLDNLALPIHRWFRYSAGFSALWVRQLIEQEKAIGRSRVFDPFSGSGTLLLEGERCNVESIGVEAHPFVARIARAKLHWQQSPKTFREYAFSILEHAKKLEMDISASPKLIRDCFPPETLSRLESLRKV